MIGYLDMPAGISGDMFLGCLVDAGWSIDRLRHVIASLKLPAEQWSVEARPVTKGSLRATLVGVRAAEVGTVPGLFVPAQEAAGRSPLQAAAHDHPHRDLDQIRTIIESAELPAIVKERSLAVFSRLAHAEAAVHGTTIDRIHFHEVGALDAIIDILGAIAGVHELGITELFASPLPLGHGWTTSAHGRIPLPAPATLELIAAARIPTRSGPGEGELVTPTGAALVAELARFQQPPMTMLRVGIGAGQRNTDWPNIARLWLGEPVAPQQQAREQFVEVQANLDDMNPQFYSDVSDQLFAAGARDVWLTPVQMKKNRPAVVLTALGPADLEQKLADIILRQTTTLGVRVRPCHRHEARREFRQIDTPFGPVTIKLKWIGEQLAGAAPEYDDCRELARRKDLPVRQVFEAALNSAYARFLAQPGRQD